MTYFRNLNGLDWAGALCDELVSAHYVPAVNMAEELLEAVEKLQSRLSENQEPRKVGIGYSYQQQPTNLKMISFNCVSAHRSSSVNNNNSDVITSTLLTFTFSATLRGLFK